MIRPSPSEHNAPLFAAIAARIDQAGSIGFDDFMSLALYHPTHGYYRTCDPTLDYQTSPQVHPVFGAMVARKLAELWRTMDRPASFDVFEAGAGDGRLAIDVLKALRYDEPNLFDACRYTLQDQSLRFPDGAFEAVGLAGTVRFETELVASDDLVGCVLSNELLDALPFRRVRFDQEALYEVNVALEHGQLVDALVPASPEVLNYFTALGLHPGDGCDAEVNLAALDWIRRAALSLQRGYVMTLDYGYEVAELYAPHRKRGSLLTFFRHMDGNDPYRRVGKQDITASVDFTSAKATGAAAGLTTVYEASQAEFLVEMGLREAIAEAGRQAPREPFYALRRAAAELTNEAGLGRIRVLIQSKGINGGD